MRRIALISLFSMVSALLIAEDLSPALEGGEPSQVDLRPHFRAVLRGKYEHSLTDTEFGRFNIRNARAVLRGNANDWISYQVQADMSDEGVFRLLDADVRLRPTQNLTLRFGQTFLPFIHTHLVGPGQIIFANRSFVNRYMSGPTRDLGALAEYHFWVADLPVALVGAVFNGKGINSPLWVNDLGYAFRLTVGSLDDIQYSIKTAQMTNASAQKNELYGIDFRYFRDGLTIEAEVVRGNYISDQTLLEQTSQRVGWQLFAGQIIKTDKTFLKYIEPTVRWDMMGLANADDFSDANRLTLGMNFGLTSTYRRTELRLNYEKYFVDDDKAPIYFGTNEFIWHDKVTLELLLNIN